MQARGIGSVVPLTLCNMGDRMHTQKFSHPQLYKFLFYFAMNEGLKKKMERAALEQVKKKAENVKSSLETLQISLPHLSWLFFLLFGNL